MFSIAKFITAWHFFFISGIFAYLNYLTPKTREEILRTLINGLHRLEYRGYDSAGNFLLIFFRDLHFVLASILHFTRYFLLFFHISTEFITHFSTHIVLIIFFNFHYWKHFIVCFQFREGFYFYFLLFYFMIVTNSYSSFS
jgi:hypothetical protein